MTTKQVLQFELQPLPPQKMSRSPYLRSVALLGVTVVFLEVVKLKGNH